MLSNRRAYPTIPASNMGRAKAWYKDKLGLVPSGDTVGGVVYTLGAGTGFMLYETQFAGQAPNTLMGFDSTNVSDDVRALRAKGVVFEDYDFPGLKTVDGIADMNGFQGAWFKDSEGNILAIGNEPS